MNRLLKFNFVTLAVMAASISAASGPGSQQSHDEPFVQSYELAPGAVVSVGNRSGGITITAWNQTRAEVHAIKRAHRDRDDLRRVRIEVSHSPTRLEIRTEYESGRINADVDYDIKVPANVHIDSAHSASGEISVSGVSGRAVVSTSSGDVKVNDIGEYAKVHSVSGDVEAGNVKGRFEASTSSGGIHARDTGGISIQTVSGDVVVRNTTGGGLMNTSSGDVDVQKSRGDLGVSTVSGDIRLLNVEGKATVRSTSGGVEVEQVTGAVTARSLSGKVRINGGTDLIEAHSTSDDVIVRGANGRIDAASISGNVRLFDIESSDVQGKTTSGNVHYAGSLNNEGRYNFESLSGSVTIIFPARNCGFSLMAKTYSGKIETDFEIKVSSVSGRGTNRSLDGVSGSGCARVKATSFSGNVYIRSSGRPGRQDRQRNRG